MYQPERGEHRPSGAGSATEQARQQANQVAEQAKEQAGQAAERAAEQAQSQAERQKDRASGALGGVAQALRATGQQLREQDQGFIAPYTDQAAETVEQFQHYLSGRNVNQLLSDLEDVARREPALFVGGAFAAGLLGARFLKSSSPSQLPGQSHQSRQSGQHAGAQSGTTGGYATPGYAASPPVGGQMTESTERYGGAGTPAGEVVVQTPPVVDRAGRATTAETWSRSDAGA